MNNNFFPIVEYIFPSESLVSSHVNTRLPLSDVLILSDFDGTISTKDVTDALLQQFGQKGWLKLETDWLEGRIGSEACMQGQIALLDASLPEINEVLDQIGIDPHFFSFIQNVERLGIPVQVVSDGLDYAIHSILARHQLNHLPVFANRLWHDGHRSWRLTFPCADTHCVKASGNCKCAHLKKQKTLYKRNIYIGDGTSDFCVSDKVDVVLAKKKLIDYCITHRIPHYPFHDFSDITSMLPDILAQTADDDTTSTCFLMVKE